MFSKLHATLRVYAREKFSVSLKVQKVNFLFAFIVNFEFWENDNLWKKLIFTRAKNFPNRLLFVS